MYIHVHVVHVMFMLKFSVSVERTAYLSGVLFRADFLEDFCQHVVSAL